MKNKALFENIINWQIENKKLDSKSLGNPIDMEEVTQIEKMIGESFPKDLLEIFEIANGQNNITKKMAFLGLEYMNTYQIIKHLEFCNSLIKSEIQISDKSDPFIDKIASFYLSKAPKHSLFGLKKSWHKLEFKCGIGNYEGPYLYSNPNTTNKERTSFRIGDYSEIKETIKELHQIENNSWDTLDFIIYANEEIQIERSKFEFSAPRSVPKNSIKEIYFHNKWIPFISDAGGNYIGYDLDPDENGTKGQVIVFGRDELQSVVVGKSLTEFLTKVSDDLSFNNGKYLINRNHLFDNIKSLK